MDIIPRKYNSAKNMIASASRFQSINVANYYGFITFKDFEILKILIKTQKRNLIAFIDYKNGNSKIVKLSQ